MLKVPPIASFQVKESTVRKIIFTTASTATVFNISNAELRYNKNFVFSFRLDDGWIDAYRTAFRYFNGGNVVYLEGQTPNSPGLFYTDGCGNDVAFKSTFAINPKSITEDNPNNLSWDMVNEMYLRGWDIFNHAYTPKVTSDWVYDIANSATVSGRVITTNTDFSNTGIAVGDDIFNANSAGRAQNNLGVIESFNTSNNTITLVDTPVLPTGYTEFFPTGFSNIYGMNIITRDTGINSELDLAQSAVRSELGIKMVNFTAPSADKIYHPILNQRVANNTLRIAMGIKEPNRFNGTDFTIQEWFDSETRVDGIGCDYDFNSVSDPNMTRTATDLDFINTHLNTMATGSNAFFTIGSHRTNYREQDTGFATSLRYLTFKDFFDRLESTYGKSGNDSMWMSPINEVYEYWITKENTNFNVIISGNTVEVTCDFSNVSADFREHALTLLVDTDVNIVSVAYQNFGSTSENIGYDNNDNTTALVNVSYVPEYDAAVVQRGTGLLFVSNLESTQNQADLDIAQNFVNTLPNGSFKNGLQIRIDNVTVIPDAQIIQIDFGFPFPGYMSPFPWNNFDRDNVGLISGSAILNLNNTLGNKTGISIAVTEDFEDANGSTRALEGDSNAPYPWSAVRDGFENRTSDVSTLKFSNLDSTKIYDFIIYGSRGFIGGDSTFSAIGNNVVSGTLTTQNNGSNNTYVQLSLEGVIPTAADEIDFTTLGYLNVIQLVERNPT